MKPISQREARALKKRVAELETAEDGRRSRWALTYPGGVHLGSLPRNTEDWFFQRLETARMLSHAVVATTKDGAIHFYALPLPRK